MKIIRFNIILAVLITVFSQKVFAQNWITNYNSHQRSTKCFTLTNDEKNNFGTVWWPTKLDLTQPQSFEFTIYLGDKDGTGADGMAFVLHNDPRGFNARGDAGGGLGYGEHGSQPTTEKILPSVSIEFDTWDNKLKGCTPSEDIPADHTTVVYNGDICNPQFPPIQINPVSPNVEDNECHDYIINWTPNANGTQTIEYYFDGQLIFTHSDDMINNVFGGVTDVFYGFTGSTGGSMNEQTICLTGGNTPPVANVDSATTEANLPVVVNVTGNDIDPDGDQLDTMRIHENPKNGIIQILDYDNIQYTPNANFIGIDSFKYIVYDINSLKCYAKRDTTSVYINVTCPSFNVTANKLTDNIKCMDRFIAGSDTTYYPDNGSIEAFVDTAGIKNNFDFSFHWLVQDTEVFNGPIYSGLDGGSYQVYARHNATGCISDTTSVLVDSLGYEPVVSIIENQPLTDCAVPDGELEAFVYDGPVDDSNNYDYLWYIGSEVYTDLLGTGKVAGGLEASTYTALAINKLDGCFSNNSETVSSNVTLPIVSSKRVYPVRNCKNLNDGSIEVSANGNNNNYIFNWFRGSAPKPAGPDFAETGPLLANLTAGFYTVTATSKNNSCTSYPITIEVLDNTNVQIPEVVLVSHQVSCDPSNPLGEATVSIGGVTSGYVFKWYKGLNQKNPPISNGPHAENLPSGTYTVVVTGNAFACPGVGIVEVKDSVIQLDVDIPTIVGQSSCAPPNGSLTAAGSGGLGSFEYYWFNTNPGATADTTAADFKGETYNGLSIGSYWVVAVDTQTRCQSDPVEAIVPDTSSSFADLIGVAVNQQTSCDLSNPIGMLSADVDGVTAGYTFRWFTGSYAPGSIPGGTGIYSTSRSQTDANLAAGDYTVFIRSSTTGCEFAGSATIINAPLTITGTASATDQTNCLPENGSVTATGMGGSSYDYYWYNSNPGSNPDSTLADFIGQNYSNLAAQNYYLIIADQATRCTSAPISTTVAENVDDFTASINTATTPNVSCAPGLTTGTITADVAGITAGYEFRYFSGQFAPGTIPVGVGISPSNLASGIYTVFVKNSTTGCEYSVEATVVDAPILITLSVDNIVDQTYCDPANGSATVSATGGYGLSPGYNYYWFDSNPGNSPDTTTAVHTGSTYGSLNAGSYWVVAADISSRCLSAVETISIGENTTDFSSDINVVTIPNASCIPGLETGSISADVAGITTGYTFRYFTGQFAAGTIPVGAGINPQNLASGTYTVFVRDNTTGCEFPAETTILDVPQVVSVSIQNIVGLTQCDPLNGEASVAASGGFGASPAYDYYWYANNPGTNPDTLIANYSGSTYSGLDAQDYYVVAADKTTRCLSPVIAATIPDNRTDFTALINIAVTNNTSCFSGLSTGSLSADVSGVTAGYQFRYFAGQFAAGTIPAGAGINPTNLAAGIYTVFVEDISTGCEYGKEVTISNSPQIITLNVDNTINQTNCTPPNGSATVSATGGYGATPDYNYYWYDSDPGNNPDTTTAIFEGSLYQNLAAANYWVVAADKITRCISQVENVTILDNSTDFTSDINFTSSPNTSCLVTFNTGSLVADVSGVTAGYTFRYFSGQFAPGVIPAGPGISPQNLSVGTYTVFVENNSTGCEYSKEATITNLPQAISLSIDNLTAVTQCDPVNGEASVIATGGYGSNPNYDYYWYDNNPGTNPDTTIADFTGSSYSGLDVQDYYVIAADKATRCVSSVLTVTVPDNRPDFSASINLTAQDNSSCFTGFFTGSINADVAGATAGYQFRYFNGQFASGTIPSGSGIIPSNLEAGTYTVFVKSTATGCEFSQEIIINNSPQIIGINLINQQDQSTCAPPNGLATVEGTGGYGTSPDYDIYWYNYNPGTNPDTTLADFNGFTYAGIAAGTYYAVAADKATRCLSPVLPVNIGDAVTDFTAQINVTVVANTSCTPALNNGSLVADVSGNTAGYTFRYFSGQFATGTIPSGAGIVPDMLNPGIYTVFVRENSTGCEYSVESTITNTPQVITLNIDNNSPQTFCAPFNGAIEASGSGGFGNTPDYDIYWYNNNLGNNPDTTIADFEGQNYLNLENGSYWAVAADKGTRCVSPVQQIDVALNTVDFSADINAMPTDNSSCLPTLPNGSITANVAGATVGYDFRYFSGQFAPGTVPVGSGIASTDLAGGIYTVFVKNNTDGCEYSSEISIQDDPLSVSLTTSLVSDQTNCAPSLNGEISAIASNSLSAPASYNYYWYDANPGSNPDTTAFDHEGASYTGLSAGTYYVLAADKATRCFSTVSSEIVAPPVPIPAVTISVKDYSSCDPSQPNGGLTADVTTQPESNYTFEWFNGTNTLAINALPAAITSSSLTGTSNEGIIGLPAGSYRVKITDITTNCSVIEDEIINSIPTVDPVIDGLTAQDLTQCNPHNGEISVDGIDGGSTIGYSFHWFEGTAIDYSQKLTPELETINGLAVGSYTVKAINNDSKCESVPVSVDVQEFNPPSLEVSSINVTDCEANANNMTVNVTISGTAASPTDYDFLWYNGTDTSQPPINNDESADNLWVGTYLITATNKSTNCLVADTFSITANLVTTPVVVPSVTPVSTCGGNDGALTAFVRDGDSPPNVIPDSELIYYWFIGSSVKKGADTTYYPDYTTKNLSNLTAGNYTVIVKRSAGYPNTCPSAPVTVTIDEPAIPTLTTTKVNNTNCAGGDNGSINITANTSGGPYSYSFERYRLSDMDLVSVTDPNGHIFNNLSADDYQIVVTNQSTNCKDTATINIIDNLTIPIVNSQSIANETICDANGQIEITSITTGGDLVTDYEYYWYKDDPTSSPLTSGGMPITGNIINSLSAGTYYVKASLNNTQCISSAKELIIQDLRETPLLTFSNHTIQTSCDPTAPTGGVLVTANQPDGIVDNYSFTWTDPGTAPLTINNNPTTSELSGAVKGTYNLVVTNLVDNCQATASFTINEKITLPTISLNTKSDQTYCGTGNGSIAVTAQPSTPFTYTWYANSFVSGSIIGGETSNSINGLVAGSYYVTAQRDDNLCTSQPLQVIISDLHTNPVANFSNPANQTSCDPANFTGAIQLNATEVSGTPGSYSFDWSDPNSLPVPGGNILNTSNQSNLTNLASGKHSVLLTNIVTGCSSNASYSIIESIITPTLSANKIDQTYCSPANGSITISPTPSIPSYTYTWYQNTVDPGNIIVGETLPTLSGRTAGIYLVEAQRDDNLCSSLPMQIEILDKHTLPVLAFSNATIQTSCDPSALSGGVTLEASEVSGVSNPYTFSWTDPSLNPVNAANINTISPNSTISAVSAGEFTALVQNTVTGCIAQGKYTITENLDLPDVSIIAKSDNIFCVNGNGSLEAEASSSGTPSYTYQWFQNTVAPANLIGNVATLTNLTSGTYLVEATRSDNLCVSAPLQVEITDKIALPLVSFTNISSQTSCDPLNPTGAVLAEANEISGTLESYNFGWTDPNGNLPSAVVNTGSNLSQVNSAIAGKYTLNVINTITGCQSNAVFTMQENIVHPTISLIETIDQTYCSTGNGRITVTGQPNTDTYQYYWYENIYDPANLIPAQNTEILDNLLAGTYFVIAEKTINLCQSAPLQVQITDESVEPIINFSNSLIQTSCDISNPTGGVTANITEIPSGAYTYSFAWIGPDSNPPVNIANTSTSSTLSGTPQGKHLVTVTNDVTGCDSQGSYTISENLEKPSISLLTKADNIFCINGNGNIEVEATSSVLTSHNFVWYSNSVAPANQIGTGASIGNLIKGIYLVEATRTDNLCTSSPFQVEIIDQIDLPVVTFSNPAAQTSCDPLNPTGAVSAEANEISGLLESYSFNWTDPNGAIVSSIVNTGANLSQLNGAMAGKYSLQVTNTFTGCESNVAYNIQELITNPTINLIEAIDQTYCTSGNGRITVSGDPGVDPYTYHWFSSSYDPANLIIGQNNALLANLSAGSYFAVAENTNNLCQSAPLQINLLDQHVNPIVNFNNSLPQTSCDPLNQTGAVEAVATETPSGPYTYSFNWTDPNGTSPSNVIHNSTSSVVNDASSGIHRVEVTNTTTGCIGLGSFNIVEQITLPTIQLISKTDQTFCVGGDGSIEVAGTPNTNSYTYQWVSQSGVFGGNGSQITNLESGTYEVTAQQTNNLCVSLPLIIEINDLSTLPVIQFSNLQAQSNCSPQLNGYTGAVIATPQEIDGTVDSYNFNWLTPGISENISSNNLSSQINSASKGKYSLTVTNTVTGCIVSGAINIDEALEKPGIQFVSKDDPTLCVGGNGKLFVEGTPSINNYQYIWFKDSFDSNSTISGEQLDSLVGQEAGIYFVVSQRTDNFCQSQPLQMTLEDQSTNPVIDLEIIQEQLALSPATPTGEIMASAYELDGSIANYTIDWYRDNGFIEGHPDVTQSTIDQQPAGQFKTIVTNQITGCINSNTILLIANPAFPQIIAMNAQPSTLCVPGNGGIEVLNINLNNQPDNVTDYDYYWFNDTTSLALNDADYVTSNQISDLPPGDYIVIAQEKTLLVTTDPTGIVIPDNSINPVVSIEDRTAQTSCNPDPAMHNGSVVVSVNHQQGSGNYAFAWYAGDNNGPQISTNAYSLVNLTSNNYAVEVTDNTTGCVGAGYFYIPERILPIRLAVSSAPNFNCIDPDGEVSVNSIRLNNDAYEYRWFNGEQAGNLDNPDFVGEYVIGLPGSIYTVVAVDKQDDYCTSEPYQVEVKEYLEYPVAGINQDAPLTTCDPKLADGQLSVKVEGNYSYYEYNWYDVTAPANTLSTQPIASNLMVGSYELIVRNIFTGCESVIGPGSIVEDITPIEKPIVEVLSMLNNCVDFDGSAQASVNGNSTDYYFEWMDNENKLPEPDRNHIIEYLYSGNYQVLATSRITGCVSPPAGFEILDLREYPEFDIDTKNATCKNENGSAFLIISTSTSADKIYWYQAGISASLSEFDRIEGLAPDTYQVDVVTPFECTTSKEFEILSDINIFNGVSANNDGENDWFIIDCIENFPNNIVKIFNRSGDLVFEMNGYDNLNNIFEGYGNKGLYLGLKELPVGTYFYVVDKNDGTRPSTGYLELVR